MTTEQALLFGLLGLVFVFLLWGRWRYDLVAFAALLAALLLGIVPAKDAFVGFGHPATVIIALVLIVSRGLAGSGVVELLGSWLVKGSRPLGLHIGIMGTLAAALSAVMNNVAALALLMPIDLQAAKAAKRSPASTLMPLSFATILGGLITLIGTPPNIIIAAFREQALGAPFGMFDFAPVGGVVAIAGMLLIVLGGWHLIPRRQDAAGIPASAAISDFIAELRVKNDSTQIGKKLAEMRETVEEHGGAIIGLVRHGYRLPGYGLTASIEAGDVVVLEASTEAIEALVGALDLDYLSPDKGEALVGTDDLTLVEAVVPPGAVIEGRSAEGLAMLTRFGVHLLGINRQGNRFRERVSRQRVSSGDVLLLLGPLEHVTEAMHSLGAMPLAERGFSVVRREKAGLAVTLFAGAILLSTFGIVYLPVALACVATIMVLTGIVPLRELYTSIEWPVIVLLGAMIPIGGALESTGATALIVDGILKLAEGQSALVVLVVLMVVTMSLSDVMNNTATAVIAAPIAVEIAARLGANPDPFLMAIAVASSCAFLTPIGHKNNMLVMGPGGYAFGDYWRLGLPLEILIVAIAVPMILLVWPL